jgi:hypothetical protein
MEPAERRTRETDTAGRPDPGANVRRLLNAGRHVELERAQCIGDAAVEQLRTLAVAVDRDECDPEVLAERIAVVQRLQAAALALMRTEPGDADYDEAIRAARRQNEEAARILTRPALRPVRVTPPRRRCRVTITPVRTRGRARPRQRRSRRGPRATRAGPDEDPAEPAEPAAPIDHAARRRGPFPPPRQERGRRG